jgi:DNA-binding NtrC family response regulator
MSSSLLIIDDDPSIITAMRMLLEEDYSVLTARAGTAGLQLALEMKPELVLLDIGLPDMNGMVVLEQLRCVIPGIIIIMMTAVDEVKTVVKALKYGAFDFLTKPLDSQDVKLAVISALETKRLRDQICLVRQPDEESHHFDVVGQCAQIKQILEVAKRISRSLETPVLLSGESGTGKAVFAKAIHYSSSTNPGPFVTVNCTAIAHDLFESELFGYDKGAFTGANSDGKTGRFEEAAGGTIFLDEIGSMPLDDQAKLLGVLEDRQFYRVGGKKPIPITSRVMAASNVNLAEAMVQGTFRRDLYYRLNVVNLELPPLRRRQEDILLLAEHFIAQYNKKFKKDFNRISTDAKKILLKYQWPGNVRELRNLIERIVLLEDGNIILPSYLTGLENNSVSDIPPVKQTLPEGLEYDEAIELMIRNALKQSGGNVLEAARILNMPHHKMRYRMKKYNVKPH